MSINKIVVLSRMEIPEETIDRITEIFQASKCAEYSTSPIIPGMIFPYDVIAENLSMIVSANGIHYLFEDCTKERLKAEVESTMGGCMTIIFL